MNETKHTEWEKNGHFFQIMMITIIARSYNMTYSLFLVFMFTAATTTEKKIEIEIEIQLMEKNSLKHEKWKKKWNCWFEWHFMKQKTRNYQWINVYKW